MLCMITYQVAKLEESVAFKWEYLKLFTIGSARSKSSSKRAHRPRSLLPTCKKETIAMRKDSPEFPFREGRLYESAWRVLGDRSSVCWMKMGCDEMWEYLLKVQVNSTNILLNRAGWCGQKISQSFFSSAEFVQHRSGLKRWASLD